MDNDLAHWILTSPQVLGADVAGLRSPDQATALVIDGYATADGRRFDYPPFGAGRSNATFMVMASELGLRLYEKMAAYVASRKSRDENIAQDNEVLAARWALDDGNMALLIADSGDSENAQDTFEKLLGFEKIQLHSSDRAVIAPKFDAARVLADPRAVCGLAARHALAQLQAAPALAASPARRRR